MRRMHHPVVVGIAVLLLAGSMAACVGQTAQRTSSVRPTRTPTPNLVGCLPTATIPSSLHQFAHVVDGATFGGPLCAFAKKYGDLPYLTTYVTDGLQLNTNFDKGVDGLQHVTRLDVSPVDQSTTWTLQQAEDFCLPFLPPDAVHVRNTEDQYGDVFQYYTSAQVAATYAPSTSGYDPSGIVVLTYFANVYGIFDCQFERQP